MGFKNNTWFEGAFLLIQPQLKSMEQHMELYFHMTNVSKKKVKQQNYKKLENSPKSCHLT